MQHTLRYAAERGLVSYEFLGSAESWTQRWTTAERATVRIAVYPFGPAGMFALGRDVLLSCSPEGGGSDRGTPTAPTDPGSRKKPPLPWHRSRMIRPGALAADLCRSPTTRHTA